MRDKRYHFFPDSEGNEAFAYEAAGQNADH